MFHGSLRRCSYVSQFTVSSSPYLSGRDWISLEKWPAMTAEESTAFAYAQLSTGPLAEEAGPPLLPRRSWG
jgi:hypothetical protein